jgi:hypothetical protein
MTFDIDSFAAADPTAEQVLTGTLRKLLRRGYGVGDVVDTPPVMEAFDSGPDTQGARATRVWNIELSGAPDLPDFSGVLAVRETSIVYGATDPAGRPEKRWYELLPDSVATVKVLKANDGY